ncbi:hypothetical protein OSB04_un000143 [Centaurea solstitialis]|uniref:Uncharacterized protein n=1 Tax=Centaurea solstitialis TaxID=347529 RepID=A0AA38S5N2_9ASTR|nr:hypothetical protein OSB04_un000143 [Centaurea solstitialis]
MLEAQEEALKVENLKKGTLHQIEIEFEVKANGVRYFKDKMWSPKVDQLRKRLSMETVVLPLEEVQINEQLRISGEPIETLDQEVKQLRHSKIPIVKVWWNSKYGLELPGNEKFV